MSQKYLFIILILVPIVIGYFVVRPREEVGKQNQSFPPETQNIDKTESGQISQPQFLGEKGDRVDFVDGRVNIIADGLDDNLAHHYHIKLPDGKMIYFFVVKDKTGIYRAAANACQVCFDSRMGFRQEGDFMVCNTCGNKYPLEKIATEKGGCNPVPINPNLELKSGKLIIEQSDLERVSDFF